MADGADADAVVQRVLGRNLDHTPGGTYEQEMTRAADIRNYDQMRQGPLALAAVLAVAAIAGLGRGTDAEIGRLGPDDAVRLVAAVDRPEADAIFVSCTNWHCLEAVPELEARLGKPVVTSNLAGAWAALQAIGLDEAAPASGTLLDRYLGLGVAA